MWWRGFIVGLLLLMLGVTSWLRFSLDRGEGAAPGGEGRGPDSYMKRFIRTDMDTDGKVKSRLRAEYMEHFAEDDSTTLTKPRLEVYNDHHPHPWHVSAEKGWIGKDSELIRLTGDVHVWRIGEDATREIEIIAEDLRVFPKNDYAETENAATIITPTSTTSGMGMRANFIFNRVELLQKVKTRYEKKPSR